jgi:hypothetical protein
VYVSAAKAEAALAAAFVSDVPAAVADVAAAVADVAAFVAWVVAVVALPAAAVADVAAFVAWVVAVVALPAAAVADVAAFVAWVVAVVALPAAAVADVAAAVALAAASEATDGAGNGPTPVPYLTLPALDVIERIWPRMTSPAAAFAIVTVVSVPSLRTICPPATACNHSAGSFSTVVMMIGDATAPSVSRKKDRLLMICPRIKDFYLTPSMRQGDPGVVVIEISVVLTLPISRIASVKLVPLGGKGPPTSSI